MSVRVLVLDNYDSFTWNLVHGLEVAGGSCTVRRSDEIDLAGIDTFRPDRIVFSPGPFGPDRTGVCRAALKVWSGRVPILGVCLGMQVIATEAGARIAPSGAPVHGKADAIHHDGAGLFRHVPSPFQAARYHSLAIEPSSIPADLEVSARTGDGVVMGVRSAGNRTEGLLFHPESFLTEHGAQIFSNFLTA